MSPVRPVPACRYTQRSVRTRNSGQMPHGNNLSAVARDRNVFRTRSQISRCHDHDQAIVPCPLHTPEQLSRLPVFLRPGCSCRNIKNPDPIHIPLFYHPFDRPDQIFHFACPKAIEHFSGNDPAAGCDSTIFPTAAFPTSSKNPRHMCTMGGVIITRRLSVDKIPECTIRSL